jgi:uncharacterized protein with GYD domain
MAKFLIKASYTSEGTKGVLKSGGTKRKEVVEKMFADIGGKLEAFYFAFGDDDVYAIIDLPDAITAAALALTIKASGMVALSTTLLLTSEEVDKAAKMSVHYLPPGS